jgi:hypothetical protein
MKAINVTFDNVSYKRKVVRQQEANEMEAERVTLHAWCSREREQATMIGASLDQAPSFPHDLPCGFQTR